MERTQYWHEINGINYSDVKFLDIYDDTVEIIAQVRTETPPYVIASSGNQLIVYHVKIENNERMSLHEIKRIQHDGDVRQIKVLFPKFRKFQSQTKSQSCALFTTSSNGTLQGFVIHIVKKEQDIDVKHRLVQSWKLHDLSCDCLDICLSQNHDEFTVVTGGEDGVINVLHLTKNLPITDKDFKYSTKEITQKIHTGRPITSIRYQIRDGIAGIAANQKFVTTSDAGDINSWDLSKSNKAIVTSRDAKTRDPINVVDIHPTIPDIIAVGTAGKLQIWDLKRSYEPILSQETASPVWKVTFLKDDPNALLVGTDGEGLQLVSFNGYSSSTIKIQLAIEFDPSASVTSFDVYEHFLVAVCDNSAMYITKELGV